MKNKKILIMVSSVILLSVVLFIGSLISKQDTELDEVKLNDLNKDSFAIMVEQSDGTYAESNTYPTGNYMLSKDRSGCIDKNGKAIPNSVSYKNGSVTFKTNSSSYCYVYFDKLTLVKYLLNEETRPSSLWTSTLDGDGYRFVGTDPNNYICFGSGNKDECVGNTDLYMYRIIGIFEDADGKQYVKLIKKEALNTAYAWHTESTTEKSWEGSSLYTNLHGSYFLNNTAYPYMQNTIWLNKIKDWTWSAVNTKTYSNSGPNYYSVLTSSQVYYHEMNHANKASVVGEWTTPSGKIGLMYGSDYMLSLGESALNAICSSGSSTLKTGWMSLANNDSSSLSTTKKAPPNTSEWTMSRYGRYSSYNRAWYLYDTGYLNYAYAYNTYSVRPVFYLVSNEEYVSGSGSKTDPFIIDGRTKYTVSVSSTNTSYGTVGASKSVSEGDTAYIELIPSTHYTYSSNTCGGTVSGNTLVIPNVTGNMTCTVTFEKTKYKIDVTSNSTSYGTVSPSTKTVTAGESATFTLSPATGYGYSSNTCGGTVSGNTLTVPATSAKSCIVYFTKNYYTVEFKWCIAGSSTCIDSFGETYYVQHGDFLKLGSTNKNYDCECDPAVGSCSTYKGTYQTGNVYYEFRVWGVQGSGTCIVWQT